MFCLYLPRSRASRQSIIRVEFKFVGRHVLASVLIEASKLKFVAESRTRVYFVQHVALTCNIVMIFAARQVGYTQISKTKTFLIDSQPGVSRGYSTFLSQYFFA